MQLAQTVQRRAFVHFRRVLLVTAGAVALTLAAGFVAQAQDTIDIQMDQAKLLKVPEGTDTLVIGNPLIADVTVQKNQVMVLTGKNYGTTNMIALDSKGAIISESTLVVASPSKDRLSVLRGKERETYSCNPECDAIVQLGDADSHFGKASSQAQTRSTNVSAGTNPGMR